MSRDSIIRGSQKAGGLATRKARPVHKAGLDELSSQPLRKLFRHQTGSL
jgi:hypothetical protein